MSNSVQEHMQFAVKVSLNENRLVSAESNFALMAVTNIEIFSLQCDKLFPTQTCCSE